jgi:hypothetical protein
LSGGGDAISLSETSQHEDDNADMLSETTSEKNVDIECADKSIDECKARRCRQEEMTHHSLWSK